MIRRWLFASLAAIALGTGAAGPAMAHEGDGVLEVAAREPMGGGVVRYVVRLTWENDGHAATDSTLTATPTAADGSPQTPVPLEPVDQDGRYAAAVTFPSAGSWTVRFTAVTPAATAEVVEEVTPPEPVTTATTATPTTSTEVPTTFGDTTIATQNEAGGDSNTSEAAAAESAAGGGSGVGWIIAVVVLVGILAGVVVGFVRSKRRLPEGS